MAKPNKIYIDLDSLLDTRLGTLAKINDSLASDNFDTNYHFRERDSFKGISREEFKKAYAKRDEETLSLSRITNIFKFVIPKLIIPLIDKTRPNSYVEGLILEINLYPYLLDDETKQEIHRAISVWIENLIPITLVTLSIEERTPEHCRDNYVAVIQYEHADWLNYHYNCSAWSSIGEMASKVVRLPKLPFFVPALLDGQDFNPEELNEEERKLGHPLKAYEFMVSLLVKLEFIDVEYFSIIVSNEN